MASRFSGPKNGGDANRAWDQGFDLDAGKV
jgi:hypothetical protein